MTFDPGRLPSGKKATDVLIFTAPLGSSVFQTLPTTVVDDTHVVASVTHFSVFVPEVPEADAAALGGDATMGVGATDGGPLSDTTTSSDGSTGTNATDALPDMTVGAESGLPIDGGVDGVVEASPSADAAVSGDTGAANDATGGDAGTPSDCQHSCMAPYPSTAQCISDGGACLVALAAGGTPMGVAVDSTSIYWVDLGTSAYGGAVMKTPIGGGPSVTLASAVSWPISVAVDSSYVYWCSNPGNTGTIAVMRAPLAGGTPQTLATGHPCSRLAINGTSVYWTDPWEGVVLSVPLDGGAVTFLAVARPNPERLAVNATNIYWSEVPADGGGIIMSALLDGGSMTTLATSGPPTYVYGLALGPDAIYWVDTSAATVNRVLLDGGAQTVLLRAGGEQLAAIALDGPSVYFAERTGLSSAILKMPIDGGSPTTLLSADLTDASDYRSSNIAVDKTSLYWSGDFRPQVFKLTPK
jgi:hypothetical protein